MLDRSVFAALDGGGAEPPFVGNREVKDKLEQAVLRGAKFITLFGAGGVGKTRVALEMARSLEQAFDGGIYAARLANARSTDDVRRAIADALSAGGLGEADPDEALLDLSRRGKTLVVLDECDAATPYLADPAFFSWIARAEKTVFVTTSRVRLGIAGETALEVSPLSTETTSKDRLSEAGALLETLLRAASGDVAYTDEVDRIELTNEIALRLDGLPLAMTLAASLALDHGLLDLRDRLRKSGELGGEGLPPALRLSLERSWELLDPAERRAAVVCSYFVDGFTSAAFEKLLGALDIGARPTPEVRSQAPLSALVRKSIVRASSSGGARRFHLLATVRAFLVEKRAATFVDARTAYLEYVADLLFTSLFPPYRARTDEAQRALALEIADVRTAVTALLAGEKAEDDVRVKIVFGAAQLHQAGGLHGLELSRLVDLALSLSRSKKASKLDRSLMLFVASQARIQPEEALVHGKKALALAESITEGELEAACLLVIARAEHAAERPDDAKRTVERLMAHPFGGTDRGVGRRGVVILANVLVSHGEFEAAVEVASALVEQCIEARDHGNLVWARMIHAHALLENEEYERAIEGCERLLAEASPGLSPKAWALFLRGNALLASGRLADAERDLLDAKELFERFTRAVDRIEVDTIVAELRYLRGEITDARRLIDGPLAEARRDAVAYAYASSAPICLAVACSLFAASGEQAESSALRKLANDALEKMDARPGLRHAVETMLLLADLERTRREDEGAFESAAAAAAAWLTKPVPRAKDMTSDAIVSRRVLASRLETFARGAKRNLVRKSDGNQLILPSGEEIDLGTSPALRQLVDVLLKAHAVQGHVTVDEILVALWPNEKPIGGSGRNRIYVLFNRLRKLGFREIIEHVPQGWRLSPDVEVREA